MYGELEGELQLAQTQACSMQSAPQIQHPLASLNQSDKEPTSVTGSVRGGIDIPCPLVSSPWLNIRTAPKGTALRHPDLGLLQERQQKQ